VLPRTRREDTWFRDWVTRNSPDWTEAGRRPARRSGQPPDVLSVYESPLGSADGHRIIWIRSTAKRTRDTAARATRIERATSGLDDLTRRLAGPKCRLKTRVAVTDTADAILAGTDCARYFDLTVTETRDKTYTAEHRGNPGPDTRFRQTTRPRFTITWRLRHHVIRDEAASDGCYPLITNDPNLTPPEVLAAYRYQPHLERRHHCLKGPQAVAPMNLHSPARIEALLCCHFIALLIAALIERQIRTAMTTTGTPAIALYPEHRDCPAPSATRILKILAGLHRHQLSRHSRTIQVFDPELTALQHQALKLLGIPTRIYRPT
jgi:hypothetical protein